jgi:hypothetical protein
MINLIKYGAEDIQMTGVPSWKQSRQSGISRAEVDEAFERYEREYEPPTLLSQVLYTELLY